MWKKIIIVFLIFFIIAVVLFLVFSPKKQPTVDFPAPTPYILDSEEATSGAAQDTNPVVIEEDRRSGFILQMAQGLPYYGKNFSLYYDFNSDSFILHINPQARTEGNNEYAAFLKKNNVDDPSWITNITTIYTSP